MNRSVESATPALALFDRLVGHERGDAVDEPGALRPRLRHVFEDGLSTDPIDEGSVSAPVRAANAAPASPAEALPPVVVARETVDHARRVVDHVVVRGEEPTVGGRPPGPADVVAARGAPRDVAATDAVRERLSTMPNTDGPVDAAASRVDAANAASSPAAGAAAAAPVVARRVPAALPQPLSRTPRREAPAPPYGRELREAPSHPGNPGQANDPTIEIHIGRIDVRAAAPSKKPPGPPAPQRVESPSSDPLARYLRQRSHGARS